MDMEVVIGPRRIELMLRDPEGAVERVLLQEQPDRHAGPLSKLRELARARSSAVQTFLVQSRKSEAGEPRVRVVVRRADGARSCKTFASQDDARRFIEWRSGAGGRGA